MQKVLGFRFFVKDSFIMYDTFLSQSLTTHTPYSPTLKRLPNSKSHYQVLALDKTFNLKTDLLGNAVPGMQECKGVVPLPRDGRIYPGVIQSLRDGGCEMLVSLDYQRDNVAHLKKALFSLYTNFRLFRTSGVSPKQLCIILFCDGLKELQDTFSANEDDSGFLQQFIEMSAISEKFSSSSIEQILNLEFGSANIDPEVAHCFQSLIVSDESESEPVQLVCVVKHFSRRKLNSRLWFFKGFCETIRPKFCTVVNAGVLPDTDSIWQLYSSFKHDVGVVVGEVLPEKIDSTSLFGASFAFKQTMSLKLNRYLEGAVGAPCTSDFQLVAFRFSAVRGEPLKRSLLDLYCPTKHSPYNINKFSCGDCFLALATVSRKGDKPIYCYQKSAKARVEIPTDLQGYLEGRRAVKRVEMFMFFEAIKLWKKSNSSENPFKKIVSGVLILYFCLKFCVMWCSSALTIAILMFPIKVILRHFDMGFVAGYIATIYCFIVMLAVVMSLSNQTFKLIPVYKAICAFFSVHFVASVLSFGYCYGLLGQLQSEFMLLCAWLVVFLLSAAVTRDLASVPWLSLQHFVMIPTESSLVTVNLFCSLHNFYFSDWLSKNVAHRFSISEDFHLYRTYIVLSWALCNWFVYFALRNGNVDLDGVMISTKVVWYGVLCILIGLDFMKLLISVQQLCIRKPQYKANDAFFIAEPEKSVKSSDSSGEFAEGNSEPGVNLLESSHSRSGNMAEELESSNELNLSIQSIDLGGRYIEDEFTIKNFSGISSVLHELNLQSQKGLSSAWSLEGFEGLSGSDAKVGK